MYSAFSFYWADRDMGHIFCMSQHLDHCRRALIAIGLGVMSAVSHTKRRDPPSDAPGL